LQESINKGGEKVMKKKICFVVQRYGLEVNGGAELQCRQLAEHISEFYDVTVLTTKAIDYVTWRDEYLADDEIINGVKVLRFGVERERDMEVFSKEVIEFYDGAFQTEREQIKWLENQGPYVPALLSYIKKYKNDYDVFVFFTYLYYTTVMGIKEVAQKAIVIPDAHDEPFLAMIPCQNVFKLPQAIFYNTEEERQLIEEKITEACLISDIGGVGIEVPAKTDGDSFSRKYHLENYMIYVGRIDVGKNCHILFDYFQRYKHRNPNNLKLVLMGRNEIAVPQNDDIVNLGFVSDKDKFAGIAEADFLILPSEFESLSMVILEAFAMEVPVLVNGVCNVLRSHCLKSNGGLYYKNYEEFEGCVNYMLNHPAECKAMGMNGSVYVAENYKWSVIVDKLGKLIEFVADRR